MIGLWGAQAQQRAAALPFRIGQGRVGRAGGLLAGAQPRAARAGSTGISLAMVAAAAGVACAVALPDDAAAEKAALLAALGARVLLQRPVSIAHPGHFVNVARRLAAEAARRPEGVRLDAEGGAESPLPGPEGGREGARAGAGGPGSAAAGGGAERVGGGGPGREENSSAGTDAGRQGGREACDEGSGGAGGAAKSGEAAGDGGGGGGGGGAGEAAPARRVPWAGGGAVFADQFENLANYRAHLETGAEIWAQVRARPPFARVPVLWGPGAPGGRRQVAGLPALPWPAVKNALARAGRGAPGGGARLAASLRVASPPRADIKRGGCQLRL